MIIDIALSLQLEPAFARHPSTLAGSETHKYVFVVLLEYLTLLHKNPQFVEYELHLAHNGMPLSLHLGRLLSS